EELVIALHGLRSDQLVGLRVPSHPRTVNQVSYVLLDVGAADLFRSLRAEELDDWTRANPRWVNRR
ncbi:MAG TPA: LytR family transcriptional regulator, partial [Micromonospora sp.]